MVRKTFFDVCVFNPKSPTYQSLSLESFYRPHEQEKRRKYERVTRIEHASFTAIVLCCIGGTSKTMRVYFPGKTCLIAG